jgi:hypothetical protein
MPKPGTAIFLEKSKFHLNPNYQQLATVNLARIENLKTVCVLTRENQASRHTQHQNDKIKEKKSIS